MTAAQLHMALASSLGDPIQAISMIPDGVQYSKLMRDDYLDRAINYVLKEYYQKSQQARADDESALIWGLFPTFTRNNTIAIVQYQPGAEYLYALPSGFVTPEGKPPLTIMDMSLVYVDGSGYITREQLPLVPPSEYNEKVSRRFSGTHYADNIATYYGADSGVRVYTSINVDPTVVPDHIECNYLPQPKAMVDHAWDEEVDFENMYLGTCISLAAMYGVTDRGEANEQIMGQTIIPIITKL
jgi:hypothetical protein